MTEETKRKVDAAKSYIENMYRVQYQNIQERYARWVCILQAPNPCADATLGPLPASAPLDASVLPPCLGASMSRRQALEEELLREGLSEEERRGVLAELEKRESDYTRLQRQRMSAEDFEPLTIIGRGAFGEVGVCLSCCRAHCPCPCLLALWPCTSILELHPASDPSAMCDTCPRLHGRMAACRCALYVSARPPRSWP